MMKKDKFFEWLNEKFSSVRDMVKSDVRVQKGLAVGAVVLIGGLLMGGSIYMAVSADAARKDTVAVEGVEDILGSEVEDDSADDGDVVLASSKIVTDDEYLCHIKGLKNWTVQVGVSVDFMQDVTWDKTYIKSVEVDSSKVDTSNEGTYDLVYKIKAVDGYTTSKGYKVEVLASGKVDALVNIGEEVVTDEGIKNKKEAVPASGNTSAPKPNISETNSNEGNDSNPAPAENVKPTEVVSTGNEQTASSSTPEAPKPTATPKPTEKPSESKPSATPSPKPTTTPEPIPTEKPHVHTWVDITETVNHPAETKVVQEVVQEAWVEEKPIYEEQAREICNTCGADLTGTDITGHVKNHMLNGEGGSTRTEYIQVQTGTERIEHPAVTKDVEVVVKEAWSEEKVVGQKCSVCGAKK